MDEQKVAPEGPISITIAIDRATGAYSLANTPISADAEQELALIASALAQVSLAISEARVQAARGDKRES